MSSQPVRLHVKGTVLSFQRSREVVRPNRVLLRLPQVQSREAAQWYVGKAVAYYYAAETRKNGSKLRVVWGHITKTHGNSGVVRAKFARNMSPEAFGRPCRVFMYPSSSS